MAKKDIQAIIDQMEAMAPDKAQALKQAAEKVSGQPVETIQQATEILGNGNLEPDAQRQADQFAQILTDNLPANVQKWLDEMPQRIVQYVEQQGPDTQESAVDTEEIAARLIGAIDQIAKEAVEEAQPETKGSVEEGVTALAKAISTRLFNPIMDIDTLLIEALLGQMPTADIPRISARATDKLDYPLDKPNQYIWNMFAQAKATGQFAFDTTSDRDKNGGKEAVIYFSINFDEIEGVKITRQLTPFDKRVYVATGALYAQGEPIMTLTQIHKQMGNSGQPTRNQLERINNSLDKMRAARIYIDTTNEATVNRGYPRMVYDGQLLEFRRVSAYINNTRTDAAINILAEPVMILFARQRKQITTIPRKLLESPISKTDDNLMLDDYLIERISFMKHNKNLQRKMLFATIYERCQIKSKMQKSRAVEKIKRYLDYYQTQGFIKGYTVDNEGITVKL